MESLNDMLSAEERVRMLREAPPKSWIALSEDESSIIAQAASYEEVVEKASEAGEDDPVLIMTPESWDPLVLTA
jgi:hypothetical protein